FEFRHESWGAARPALAEHGFAWCVSDTDEHPFAEPSLGATGPLAYLRLRREAYEDDDLKAWAGRIGEALSRGADALCSQKRGGGGAAPRGARRLAGVVGGPGRVPAGAEPPAEAPSGGARPRPGDPGPPEQPSFEWAAPGQAGSDSPA